MPPPPSATVVDDARFHLTVSSDGSHATVCRLRTVDVFDEIVERAPRARIVWVTGPDFDAALRALGCRDQDPPITSYVTALATDVEPVAVDGVEVRRVRTSEDFMEGVEVSIAGWQLDEEAAALKRARAAETFAHSDLEWVAFVDGTAVAYAGAVACPVGLFLTGGVTLPEARGRGAYRALVRARWDEAVRLGTPGLVVHAEEASRRVLESIGFERVCPIVELVSGPPGLDG